MNLRNSSTEEPLSLRRLRESLSNLESLERQRNDLRDRFDFGAGLAATHSERVGRGDSSRGGCEGSRVSQSSRFSSHSPRQRDTSDRWRSVSPNPLSRQAWRETDRERDIAKTPATATTTMGSGSIDAAGTSMYRDAARHGEPTSAHHESTFLPRVQRNPAPKDSALALALERSQDHIDSLQRERDDALRRAADQEAEVLRLTMLVERSEAGHVAMLDERQRELSDVQRLRQEHREALEQISRLRSEVHASKSSSEEMRHRLERILNEQRQQIDSLEEVNARHERELHERSTRTTDVETALYACLQERTALLQFMVDLLTALQTLFYDPTPFARLRLNSPPRQDRHGAGSGSRARSHSREGHRARSGCVACTSGDEGNRVANHGSDDLRELITALESEIASASQQLSAQVQRVVAEAEQSARAAGAAQAQPQPAQQMLRACAAWVEQERRRREKQGLPADRPVPSVDWSEERSQYQAATRVMETKFAQLAKLKRLLTARHSAARKKAQAGKY
eukprot:TRINITY_DN13790_c0_g1_i2.p1 TRINITY_DN13790_c0_g1~~TRINITY_DN13790_c0_g1_i2.p1  ORF type:complete len:512 (+),score=92.89 TRINITY_DN13790_c0_g1_i2:160-1695(+)